MEKPLDAEGQEQRFKDQKAAAHLEKAESLRLLSIPGNQENLSGAGYRHQIEAAKRVFGEAISRKKRAIAKKIRAILEPLRHLPSN